MSTAKAVRFDPQDHQPSLAAPLGETPVARPGFRRSMTLLVLLSIPLWAMAIGIVYGAVRLIS